MRLFLSKIKNRIYEGDNIINLYNIRYLPRWVVLFIDISLLVISLFISLFIIDKLGASLVKTIPISQKYILIVGVNIIFMLFFRTYSGIVRHSTFIDLLKLLFSVSFTVLFLGIINLLSFKISKVYLFKTALLYIYFSLSFISLFIFRLLVKLFFNVFREFTVRAKRKKILVLGIDEESVAIANAILAQTGISFDMVGFLTQRTDSKMANLLGKKIYTKCEIESISKENLFIDGVLINKKNISKEELMEWTNLFFEKRLQMFKVSLVEEFKNDVEKKVNIQNIQIEDLLNRKPIVIENIEVKNKHYKKNVLITGGAGSIGSEIVRQVAFFEPALLVVLDQAETPLYDIELEIKKIYPNLNVKFILADISNENRMKTIFEEYKFSIVYHAAAYKHVPLIEENPHEAVLVNIQGSKNLALLASRYNVDSFVMISTDKAVNPTNVMGASKRAAELFVQALQNEEGNRTKFITTRFGNVLGSNGSVIPYFRKQIQQGGPVTITHPDIVRYFMTIPEACELVLQAGTMGQGGEIFVFDMGEPVKIVDLARKMIKLSGLEPDEDIEIIYTGLRPGEKLYEELLSDKTKTLPTHHQKIMISKDETMTFEEIDGWSSKIYLEAQNENKEEVVRILKQIVKEFRSNNSVYEQLDK